MDTKLKNRHKLACILIFFTILIPAAMVVGRYQLYQREAAANVEKEKRSHESSEDFMMPFVQNGYIMYTNENGTEKERTKLRDMLDQDAYWEWLTNYKMLYPYIDYEMENEKGEVIARSSVSTGEQAMEDDMTKYAFSFTIQYDKNGKPMAQILSGSNKSKQLLALRRALNDVSTQPDEAFLYEDDEADTQTDGKTNTILKNPENCTFRYGITEKNLKAYLKDSTEMDFSEQDEVPDSADRMIYALLAAVALFACVYPSVKSFQTGEERIFQAPVEVAVPAFIVLLTCAPSLVRARVTDGLQSEGMETLLWAAVFAVDYWIVTNLRHIWTCGVRGYIKEYSLCCRKRKTIKNISGKICGTVKSAGRKILYMLEKIDFRDRGQRYMLKVVLINSILLVPCFIVGQGDMLWFLLCDAVLLFVVLNIWYRRMRRRYMQLLNAAEAIADGNLDAEIGTDLRMFQPIGDALGTIQSGFKKAVDEEVKSQRMKTELITNVSHDLKTPLTAIITYVDLLKNEKDEEKQKEYIEILERKSLRLKVLIEDLFEVSKANSQAVKLNLLDLDMVNLFKQVKLELDEQIRKSGVEFRCDFPEERLIVHLDSQKTYRIFENLLVNITKYAMPHTRAYISIREEDGEAVVHMKNVSREELHVKPEELTERFVRGDESRKTEGSGLGLAIVSSFTELQKGHLDIETEADLFKITLRFPLVSH